MNLKAELEIMELHQKMDALREKQWTELIAIQQEQLQLMGAMIEEIRRHHPGLDVPG